MRQNKQIIINNHKITFDQFAKSYDSYIEQVKHLFKPSTLLQHSDETETDKFKRIFNLLYYAKHLGVNVSAKSSKDSLNDLILNALGVDIVKRSSKNSQIVFKNSGNHYKINNDNLDYLANKIFSIVKENKTISKINKSIKFGIELEFIGSPDKFDLTQFNNAMYRLVGETRYDPKMYYNHNSGKQWILGKDASVKSTLGCGYELTSPILTVGNSADMQELKSVLELITKLLDGKTNRTCGTHIHMSFNCGQATDELITYFAKSYKDNEWSLFDRVVPKQRQSNNNRYCKSVDLNHIYDDRYRKLNLRNVQKGNSEMRLEFRQLDGTLDYDKICTWIKLQKLFINATLKQFKASSTDQSKTPEITLENVICLKEFKSNVESLMQMSKLVA